MPDYFSLIVFAVLFYLMMRHGCGAHAIHGKSHGSDSNHVDPVCGMKISQNSGYGMMHENQLYRFCSRDCMDKFESDPGHYIRKINNKEAHHE